MTTLLDERVAHDDDDEPVAATGPRAFRVRLGLIVAVGVAVRIAYIAIWRRDATVWGDAYFYQYSANLIADGHGFINPIDFNVQHVANQAADHPPLYLAYLALWSLVGVTSPIGHMLASVLLGTLTIVLVGLAGKRIAGPRVGLLAAALAALYPNVWSYDGFILSETMAMLLVSAVILAAYRYRDAPSPRGAVLLGALVGLAALSRSELLLLSVLLVTPLVLSTGGGGWPARLRRLPRLLRAGVACLLVLAPWVAFNLSRFDQPVYLSAGFEITLATSTCDDTYYGPTTGYWSIGCAVDQLNAVGLTNENSDQSQRSAAWRQQSEQYIRDHLSRLPVVLLARWGRITGLYKPIQQAQLDVFPEGREPWVAYSALGGFYLVAGFGIAGAVSLRRRGLLLYPLLAPLGVVLFAVTVTFATTRYRASAETALCLLAAVGVDALLRLHERLRDDPDDRAAPAIAP